MRLLSGPFLQIHLAELFIGRGIKIVEPLYIALTGKGYDECIYGVMPVIFAFCPVFDSLGGMCLSVSGIFHILNKFGLLILGQVEIMEDIVVAPHMAEETCYGT